VTGGAGYVGSHVARALAVAGRKVVVLDDLSTGHAEDARFGELVVGDAGDEALVSRIVRDRRIVAALHFAAKISVAESVADPEGYRRANVDVTERLARALATSGVSSIVFSSSAAVYGDPERVPIPEEHEKRPTSPYGESKRLAEEALGRSGLRVAALRYFNAAGAEPGSGLSERHDPEIHLIPLALRAATGGARLTVFGRDWPTPDGTCVRDYVHVGDLARAHLAALERLESGHPGGAWNLGGGTGTSVLEVVDAVARVTGREVAHDFGPRRPGDPSSLVADVSRAREDLGWTPERSDIDRVVSDAWEATRR
jgi:UDP-glucose-4-epimerase GalE